MKKILVIVLMVSIFIMFSCEKKHNGDAGEEAWPDHPKPIEGWVALESENPQWGGLLKVDAQGHINNSFIPENIYYAEGALPRVTVGWVNAIEFNNNQNSIYQISSGRWTYFEKQPVCKSSAVIRIIEIARFENGNGIISAACDDMGYLFIWSNDKWQIMKAPPSIGLMDCYAENNCVLFDNYGSIYKYNGEDFIKISVDNTFSETTQVSIQNNERIYAVVAYDVSEGGDTTDETNPYTIVKYEKSKWSPIEHLTEEENYFVTGPKLFRIDSHHMAVSIYRGEDDSETIILSDSGKVMRPEWPEYQKLVFAPGGSGLGYKITTSPLRYRVDLIEGLTFKTIYEANAAEGVGVTMLLAADAE